MISRHDIDATTYTSRAWQRHRDFWQERFTACDGAFALQGAREVTRVAFSGPAGRNLERISGGSDLGRVAVLLSALSRVLGSWTSAATFVVDTPPLASGAGDAAVPLILPIRDGGTVAELLREVSGIVSQSYSFQAFPGRDVLANGEQTATNVLLVCPALHGDLPGGRYDVILELDDALTVTAPPLLATHLQNVLAAFGDTARPLGAIDILSEEEVRALVPPVAEPVDASLFALFEETARQYPNRIAVESPSRVVTYDELRRDALSVAAALRARGVEPGNVVGVATSRSVEWITALLGVMAAGGAYLPVDPKLPRERVQRYLDETRAAALLDSVDVPRRDAEASPVRGSDLAYVLYTSGSTGEPKGVMIEHGGFVNMICDQIRVFGIGSDDRVLQLASASFDASLSEIFMTLLAGAALVLIDDETIADPRAFTRYVEERGVTAMTVTPLYLSALERHPLPTVRTLITAGDAAHAETTRHYARSRRVFNAYGPTEVSVCATMHRVEAAGESVPIGTAVANAAVYVVDRYGRLLPRGFSGEIWFAGQGVARGYVGRTDAAFFDDPFAAGRRCYRTGDRGRWTAEGALLFEGRADDQLKIRGHRVEPAEIERALLRHPMVAEVHAGAVDSGAHRELVAWVRTRPCIELWPSVAEFFVYDDVVYGSMAADERRNRSYRAAAERHVRGKTVLEIGPGPEAVLARICVEAGARKVYAVEISAETAARARARVAELGLADRIEIIHGDAAEVVLPEPADVCFSEIVGSIGGSEGAALLINRARRLLADPRAQIPARSVTKIAGVSLDGHVLDLRFPEIAAHYVERIFEAEGRPFDLRLCLKNLPHECIVTTDGVFEDLDFRDEVRLEDEHEVRLRVTRGGALDGLLVWLHLVVDAAHPEEAVDILESTGSWLPVYFPLRERLSVEEGDEIRAIVTRRLCANGRNPDFFIDGSLLRGGTPVAPVRYDAFHVAPGFRATLFYERLFAEGAIPVRPDATAAGLRRFAEELLPSYMVPAHVELIERMPMTRNGKVDRKALPPPRWTRAEGEAPAPRDAREEAIVAVWEEVLERRPIGVDDDFYALGGDSITAIQIAVRLAERDLHVSTRDILNHPTPAALAQKVRQGAASAPQETVEGPLPLTPIQSWFFRHVRRDAHHYNQALMLRYDGTIDVAALTRAMSAIVAHHDALRSRFVVAGDAVRARIEKPCDFDPIATFDLRGADEAELERIAGTLQGSLDLARGPLVRAAVLRRDDGDRVLWIVHHLAVDWVSWRILFADLQTAYAQALAGAPVELPAKTESIRRWAEAVGTASSAFDRAAWEPVLAAPAAVLMHESYAEENLVADAARVELQLPEAPRGDVAGALLAALARAIAAECGGEAVQVLVENHGRDAADLDVSRTVGWFTTFHPVLLDVRAQRALPAPKGFLALAQHDPSLTARLPQISFNYLGQFGGEGGGRWSLAPESAGATVSPRVPRACELDFLASTIDGQLHLSLTYHAGRFSRDTAMRLLTRLGDEVARAALPDLTHAGISQEELDGLFAD